ncbi:barstar family protein [soil metagenome]
MTGSLRYVGPSASLRSVQLRVAAAGMTPYVVGPAGSKAELIASLAAALHFPSWAGHGWDAVTDLLADLSWLPPGPLALLWTEPDLLRASDERAYRIAVEILRDATARQVSRPLTVVLIDAQGAPSVS